MQPNKTWQLLAKRATDLVNKRLRDYQSSMESAKKLESSRERISSLVESYKAKLHERQREPLSIAEASNFRGFMSQLLRLIERVDEDLARAQEAREDAKRRLLEAEIALFKMQSMVEKDQRAVQAHHKQQEQKQMDTLGITQFNLKAESSPTPASGNSVA